jgi:hypothetical protein
MNGWLILGAVAFVAVVYIIVPVGFAARGHFRSHKLVRCPVVGVDAGVIIGRAGVAEALGRRSLRRISDCTFWGRRKGCAQRCRLLSDEEIRQFRRSDV